MSEKIENVLICEDCALYFNNGGELPDDTTFARDMEIHKGAKAFYPIYKFGSVGESVGFKISSCDCCKTKAHGERYEWNNAGLN